MAQVFVNGQWQESQPLPQAVKVGLANDPSTFGGTALNSTQLAQSSAPTIVRTSTPAPTPVQSTPAPTPPPTSTATPSPAQITTQPATTTPTYSGLVGNLANTSTVGNPAVPGIVNQITTASNTNPLTSGPLADNYNKALSAYNALKQNIAAQYGAIGSEAIPLGFQQGRAQVLAQQYAAQLDAAAQNVAAAQTAMSQGITEQGQQISGLNSAGGLSNTAQGLTQSGLTSAAGLAAPIQVPYNMQLMSPLTGQSVAGSGTSGSLQDAVNNAVQLIKNGSGYSNAAATLNAYGQAGTNALIQMLGPGFNINASNASAAAAAANINTQNTTVTNTASTGYDQATKEYKNLEQTYTGAQNLGQLLASTMNKGGINSNGSIDLNQAANTLAAHLSSSDYAQFVSTLTNTANAYQAILTQGGATTPTAADSALLAILNPNSSMNAIIASLNQLNNEVYTGKILPSAAKANSYLQTLNGQ